MARRNLGENSQKTTDTNEYSSVLRDTPQQEMPKVLPTQLHSEHIMSSFKIRLDLKPEMLQKDSTTQ